MIENLVTKEADSKPLVENDVANFKITSECVQNCAENTTTIQLTVQILEFNDCYEIIPCHTTRVS